MTAASSRKLGYIESRLTAGNTLKHIKRAAIRIQLAIMFATSNLLFGCVIWGHVFGVCCLLREAVHGNAGKLVVLYRSALHWAVAAPAHT